VSCRVSSISTSGETVIVTGIIADAAGTTAGIE